MGPAWRRRYVRYRRLFLNFFNQYKERKDVKVFLEILLTLATISIFSILALRPTVVTIAGLIKEIEAKKETVAVMDEKIKNLNSAQALYEKESDKIELLETSVPYDPSPDAFTRQVEGLSGRHEVNLGSVSLGGVTLLGKGGNEKVQLPPSNVLGAVNSLVFSLNASSDYPHIFNFLSEVEKVRRPIRIKSVSVNAADTEEGRIISVVVDGETPYLEDTTNNSSP
jgi:hypothetical protein